MFDEVCNVLDDPEFHCAVKWQEVESGSILVWDNLGVQHIAPADYEPHFRLMHRCVTLGSGSPRAFKPDLDSGACPNGWGLYVRSAYAKAGFCSKKSVDFYNDTAKLYDELAHPEVWLGPEVVSEYAKRVASQEMQSARILDFGAGTGKLGLRLQEKGFQNVDAVEPAEAMLEQVPAGTYQATFKDGVDAPEASYDMIVSTGVIGTHVGTEGVKELMPKVQNGGSILFSCKYDTYQAMNFDSLATGGNQWQQKIVHGPVALNRDMPDQQHVVVQMVREG